MVEFEAWRSGRDYYSTIDICNLNFKQHTHRSYEIVFVRSGTLVVNLDGRDYTVEANQGIFISPYEIHSFVTPCRNQVFSCIFAPNLVEDFYDYTKQRVFLAPVFDIRTNWTEPLRQEQDNYFEKKALLYRICSQVLQQGTESRKERKNYELLSRISSYIQDNIQNDLSLRGMCRDLGYSYNYISGIFKSNFGVTFPTYINQIRLEQAARLLLCTDLTTAQIASECGFKTIRNFNIAFRGCYGMPPKQYRTTAR